MNTTIISALAALAGAAIGGLTYALATWIGSRKQAQADWLTQDRLRRQDLYREFIASAAKCYGDGLQHKEPDIPALIELYTTLGRMRVLSSPRVFESAKRGMRQILDTYLGPERTFLELREMMNKDEFDLLGDFADACRSEQESLGAHQF